MAAAVPIIVAAVSVVGTGLAAYGQYQQGQAAADVAQYNAQVAAQNQQQAQQQAGLSEESAVMAEQAGKAKEAQSREETRRILARQRALVGASGISTEGSPLLVMVDSAEQAEMDALRIRYGSAVEARRQRAIGGQYLASAGQYGAEIGLQRYQGSMSRRAANLGAGTSLLTGLSSAGYNLYRTYRPSY